MFAGSLVALVTPMKLDGSIDYDAWSRFLEFQLANGSAGFVVAGSTGESASISDAELAELQCGALRQPEYAVLRCHLVDVVGGSLDAIAGRYQCAAVG